MAQTIKLRRSAVAGNRPTTGQLDLGELAINTVDGKIYFERSASAVETVQEIFTTNTQNSGSLNTIGNLTITGSILISGSTNLIGDETITGSLYVNNTISGSISGIGNVTSYSTSVDSRLSNLQTKSASVDISISNINSFTSSENTKNSTLATYTGSIDTKFSTLGSYTASVDTKFSTLGNYTASVDAKWNTLQNVTSSLISKTGSYATTGSNTFIGNQTINGNVVISGSLTAQQYILSSSVTNMTVEYASGSTAFGNSFDDTHTFTGSLSITGSTTQIGNNTLQGINTLTGSNNLFGNTTQIGNITLSGSIFISGSNNPGSATASIKIFGDIEQNGYHKFLPINTNIDTSISASYIYVSGSTQDLYFSQNSAGYNNVTRLRWLESNLYTGILKGGVLSSTPGSTTFSITSGEGIIVKMNASVTQDPYPTIKKVSWDTKTNLPIRYSGSAKITYVGIDEYGADVQQTNAWGSADINQWDTQISLGVVLHLSGSVSNGVYNSPQISYGAQQQNDDFTRAFGPLKISGHTLSPSGSTLSIIKGAGVSYKQGANYVNNPNHPSSVSESTINTSKIYRYYISGSTPIIDTGAGNAGYSVIDPTKYVDQTTGLLTNVDGNNPNNSQWTIQRVFWIPNSPTNAFIVYYGNGQYTSLLNAQNAINNESFTEAPNTAQNGIFVGYILVRMDCTNLADSATAAIVQAGLFRSVAGIGASGTNPISVTLAGLSDVAISGLSAGDALIFNGGQWVNSKSLNGTYQLTGSLYATNTLSASILQATQISGSLFGNATTATSASNVLYSNIGQKPTLVSGSVQIDVLQTTNIDKIASTGSNTFRGDQIITGSLNVSGTITANEYHTTIVSSSVLYTSGSTKFGDTSDDTHRFTGSVSLRDSLTVGGTLIATAISGSGAGLTDIGVTDKVFYVSEDGADTNDGKTLSTSFRTIKAAISAASASLALNTGLPVYRQSVQVKSGYYVEEAPITVPSNVSILGDDLRSVVIRPTTGTKYENLFLMNNGTYCWGLRLEGCEIDDLDNPRKGFFFAFAPDAYIVTSPYIQNCSAISTPADKFYTPLDYENNNPLVGNGPGGMIVDDSVLNGYSPLKSMIVDAYTQVAFNGIGICIRGRGYGQLVSFFTNFSSTGVFCIDGGHASLLNSNTTFGDYGLRAQGKRMLVKPDITAVSASIDVSGSLLIKAQKTNIQNYMINKLVLSGSYNSTYISGSGSNYAGTIRDSGLLIDAISDDLLAPKASRTFQFTSGLFKGQDISTGSIYTLSPATGSTFDKGAITVFPLISNTSGSLVGDYIKSYGYMKEYVISDPDSRFTTLTTPAKNKIGQMFDVVSNTLTQVVVQNSGSNLLEEFGSLVTSTSHDFSYAGAGVNFLALPINQGGVGETNYDIRISEISGGRVFHTSGDETGDFYAGNDFIIRQATGTIEGRTFTKALSAQFTPLNLALEN